MADLDAPRLSRLPSWITAQPRHVSPGAVSLETGCSRRSDGGAEDGYAVGPLSSPGAGSALWTLSAERRDGCKLVRRTSPTVKRLRHGCLMNATVRADEAREMEIWREEVFPPVVVGPVGTIDDAEAAVSKRAHVGGVRSRGGGPALLDRLKTHAVR